MNIFQFVRQGTAHREQGAECQDAAGYRKISEDSFIMALSDGAGQAKYAKQAAWTNVNTVLKIFTQTPLEEFLKFDEKEQKRIILRRCQKALEELADECGCSDMRDFSATLLFAAGDKNRILAGHIGDGAIYMTDAEHRICFASGPENGETLRHTFFTVGSDAGEHLYLNVMRRDNTKPAMILLMSDGPHMMFRDRGFGKPEETAMEISPFILEKKVESNDELGLLLDQMTELEIEKMDDWSVLAAALLDPVRAKKAPAAEKTDHIPEYRPGRIEAIQIPDYELYNGTTKKGLPDEVLIASILYCMDHNVRLGRRTKKTDVSLEYEIRIGGKNALLQVISVRTMAARYGGDPENAYVRTVRNIREQIRILRAVRNDPYTIWLWDALEILARDRHQTELFFLIKSRIGYWESAEEAYYRIWRSGYIVKYGQCLDDFKQFSDRQILELAVHMLKALHTLEKNGILHNGIRPENILVKGKTGQRQYVLGGFENACYVTQEPALTDREKATRFSAPEVCVRGYRRGFESDIFSLGSVLFYLMNSGKSVPMDFYKKNRKIQLNCENRMFRNVILKAVALRPEERYASAAEMLMALEEVRL